MSSIAREEGWQSVSTTWASRLIPGSARLRGAAPIDTPKVAEGRAAQFFHRLRQRWARGAHTICDAIVPNPVLLERQSRARLAIAADFAIITTAWALVALVNHESHYAGSFESGRPFLVAAARFAGLAMLTAALITLLGHSEGIYQQQPWSRRRSWFLWAKSVGWGVLITAFASRSSGWITLAWGWFVAAGALSWLGICAREQLEARFRVHEYASRPLNVLIVGAGHQGRALQSYLGSHPELGRVVRGFLGDRRDFGVLGSVRDLAKVARAEFADEVIVTSSREAVANDPQFVDRIVSEARGHSLDVWVVPDLSSLGTGCGRIERWGEVPVVAVHRETLPYAKLALKRWMDAAISVSGLIAAAPLLGVIAMLIAIDSGWPIFYRAKRIGRKGRHFDCLKFRTMVMGADQAREALRAKNERQGPCFKIADDPRVTRIGRMLRRYSLDELPQLWNVLCGEMSLVGPRPHPPDDFARYELAHFRRLDVLPGITGLWQVKARENPSFETNLALDLEYIERWTLGLDCRILWQTLGVVLRGTGT